MSNIDTATDTGYTGQAAEVAAAVAAHPFFKRLQSTEHANQSDTANDGADDLASGDGILDVTAIADAVTRNGEPESGPDESESASRPEPELEPEPALEPESAPAPKSAPEPEPAPAAAIPPAGGGYRFRDGDTEIAIDDDQMRRLVGLDRWAASLPETVARQFAAIEQQVAVAVPTDEYAAFQAWRAGQTGRGTNPANPADPGYLNDDWMQDLDPQAAQEVARMRAETLALQQQNAVLAQQASVARQPDIAAEMEQRVAVFDNAISEYATATGLTPDQAGELLEMATAAGVIPVLIESQRHYSPSGMLIQDADLAVVARQALAFARAQRPDLAAPAPGAAPPLTLVPAPASTTAPTVPTAPDPTAQKRARASSLAAAPSAATTPPGFNPATAAPQQQRDAIAGHLRDLGIAR